MSYYQFMVNKLGDLPEYADLKMQNEHGETHWMRVTPEQIQAILQILKQTEEV